MLRGAYYLIKACADAGVVKCSVHHSVHLCVLILLKRTFP